LRMVNERGLIK